MPTRSHPAEHYALVAELAQEASTDPYWDSRINIYVAETLAVPLTTAARWVKVARAKGLLGPREAICSCRCPVHCPDQGEEGKHRMPTRERTYLASHDTTTP